MHIMESIALMDEDSSNHKWFTVIFPSADNGDTVAICGYNKTKAEMEKEMEEDRISAIYKDKIVFITGGSGFMGKVLIEKLLRCTELKQIYLLLRTKRGKDPNQRIDDVLANPLFDLVKEIRGTDYVRNKFTIFGGDVSLPDLALIEEDRKKITENVDIIYHLAATIRFDELLKKAVLLNTRGTKLMTDLAKECKKLELFCHVSTSYSHLNEKVLYEKPYPPAADPYKIIAKVETTDDKELEAITSKILGDLPNTYAFTKSLSEGIVVDTFNEIPSMIVRPSIVVPIYKEPIPGWTDNINGPAGLLIGAGKGVIRTMYVNSNGYGDFLPVDIAINGIFVATWNFIANKDLERRVIHMTSSAEIRVSWEEIINMGRWIIENKVPLNGILWYPGGSMKSNRLLHNICMVLFHWIPAILIDCLLVCLGYKPVLCRVQRRIVKGFEVFEYYANNRWDFDNSNALYMRTIINETERKKYKIDAEGLDLMQYFENCIKAARIYILKESVESLPAARRNMRRMWWLDKTCKTIIVGLFIYYVGGYFFSLLFSLLF